MVYPLKEAREKPDSLKGRILAEARRVFAKRGYHGTSTRKVAEAVGIDVSTLYYHWRSKQDLFDGILADLQMDFEERLRAWVLETKDLSLEQCFEKAVEHFAPFFLNRDVVRVLMFSFFDDDFAGKNWALNSQKQLVQTMRVFVQKRFGIEQLSKEFDLAVLAFIASTLILVGSRNHLSEIVELDGNSLEYRDLVISALRRSVHSFLRSMAAEYSIPLESMPFSMSMPKTFSQPITEHPTGSN